MRAIYQTFLGLPWAALGPACAAYTLVGLSFGALCASQGVPPFVPVALSLLVFAGSAQFAALGVVLAGGSVWLAAATGIAINARLATYGLALGPAIGRSLAGRLLGAHLLSDVNTALALRSRDSGERRRVALGAGAVIFVLWNVTVGFGVVLGQWLPNSHRFGLDAALPAILFAIIRPALAEGELRRAALAGSLIALLSGAFLPPGLPVFAALGGLAVAPGLWRDRDHVSRGRLR